MMIIIIIKLNNFYLHQFSYTCRQNKQTEGLYNNRSYTNPNNNQINRRNERNRVDNRICSPAWAGGGGLVGNLAAGAGLDAGWAWAGADFFGFSASFATPATTSWLGSSKSLSPSRSKGLTVVILSRWIWKPLMTKTCNLQETHVALFLLLIQSHRNNWIEVRCGYRREGWVWKQRK